jgi:ribosomal protein S12
VAEIPAIHEQENALVFIWEIRVQDLPVSVRIVVMKASQIDAEFRRKTARAKDH